MTSYIKYCTLVAFVFVMFFPQVIHAQDPAVLILSPSADSYKVNDEFTVELKINSPESITALKAYLNFDPSLLSVIGIDTENSAFPYWWEKDFDIDNETGEIKLQASTAFPGYSGNDGLVAKISFRAKSRGAAGIGYSINSLALRPDDKNVLSLAQSTPSTFDINGEDTSAAQKFNVKESILNFGTVNIILTIVAVLAVVGAILFRKKLFLK